jgi:hypothetical protein
LQCATSQAAPPTASPEVYDPIAIVIDFPVLFKKKFKSGDIIYLCVRTEYYAGAPGIQAPQIGQQHNSQLQKSLAVPPRTGNFDTLLHSVEISDSRETVDQVRKLLKREHARPETGFRPRHCGIHRATHVNTSKNN